METVTVNKQTLQKLLDYMSGEELRDFEECVGMEWTDDELENHAYSLILELQNTINAN